MPLEDVRQVVSTNWKAVVIAIVLVALTGMGSLLPLPYGLLISLASGIALLYVGTKLQRTPFVKTFSRSHGTDMLLVSDNLEAKVTKAAEKKET